MTDLAIVDISHAQKQDAELFSFLADGVSLSFAPAFLTADAMSQSPFYVAGAMIGFNATAIDKIGPELHPPLPKR